MNAADSQTLAHTSDPVSYTHLDVYKRQVFVAFANIRPRYNTLNCIVNGERALPAVCYRSYYKEVYLASGGGIFRVVPHRPTVSVPYTVRIMIVERNDFKRVFVALNENLLGYG